MSSHEKKQGLTFKHFSHTHDLQLSFYDESQKTVFCAACKHKVSGWICGCKICSNYVLHFQCSLAPEKIQHPFHRAHTLTLLPEQGLFKCQACGHQGSKFSYSYGNYHLHFDCAITPSVLTHPCHIHSLKLVRSTLMNTSKCKVCNIPHSTFWYYECFKGCNFSTHIDCAKSNKIYNSSTNISSTSTHNESDYDVHDLYSFKPKVQKSSAETSNKGKEKGSNPRNQDHRPSVGNRFGNRNFANIGDGNSYGEVKKVNRKNLNYDSTRNSGQGGSSGNRQPYYADNTNHDQYEGSGSDYSPPDSPQGNRFGNRKNVGSENFGGRNNYGYGINYGSGHVSEYFGSDDEYYY